MKKWRWWSALVLLMAAQVQAQDAGELAWSSHVEPVPGVSGQVDVVFTAPITAGWIVYGSDFTPADFGPRPAKVLVQGGGQAVNAAISDGARTGTSKNFAGEYRYTYFANQARFRQRVQLEPGAQAVKGVLNGQSCFEESGLCTLFRESFAIALE